MKPLWRWTIGPCHSLGVRVLMQSVENMQTLYGNTFDFLICYNNIDDHVLPLLEATGVPLLDQWPLTSETDLGEAWKLIPARVRPEAHEIVCDNDLLLFRHCPKISQWLGSDRTLLLRGRGRYYGQYDHRVPADLCVNSGLYGMPPNFDLAAKLAAIQTAALWQDRQTGMFDDQGLLAASLGHQPHIMLEPRDVFNYDTSFASTLSINACGVHLIDANRLEHPGWLQYLQLCPPHGAQSGSQNP
jgi:hypothetical protein